MNFAINTFKKKQSYLRNYETYVGENWAFLIESGFYCKRKNSNKILLFTFNHGDIVGTIADRERDSLLVSFNKIYYGLLLTRRYSTANNRFAQACKLEKFVFTLAGKSIDKTLSVYD